MSPTIGADSVVVSVAGAGSVVVGVGSVVGAGSVVVFSAGTLPSPEATVTVLVSVIE